MKLIVGLGNPGWRYRNTRHNAGAMAVQGFAKALGIKIQKRLYKGLSGQGAAGALEVVLLIPETFMNLSGEAVLRARSLVSDLSDILIVYDDIDLGLGTLRFKPYGSSGGHKGLGSVIRTLGTDKIPRLRIGIRPDKTREEIGDTAEFVLRPFDRHEREQLADVLEEAVSGMETWVRDGIDVCMTRYNNKG